MRAAVWSSTVVIFALSFQSPPSHAQTTWQVDDDSGPLNSIQEAIDQASSGDTISVAPGTYFENIDLLNKKLVIRGHDPGNWDTVAATIIDGNVDSNPATYEGPTIIIAGGQGRETVIEGLSITGGTGKQENSLRWGGGIFCDGSSPTLRRLRIYGNRPQFGGGLFIRNSSALVVNVIIADNEANNAGGGILCTTSPNAEILSSLIVNNRANGSTGGGIDLYQNGAGPLVRNNTIVGNTALVLGGGGLSVDGSDATILNNIIASNTPQGILNDPAFTGSITYNDFWQNGTDCTDPVQCGPTNLFADPLFVDVDGADNASATWQDNDYHLQSTSPCINAGDPASGTEPGEADLDGDDRILAGRVDIGVDESVSGVLIQNFTSDTWHATIQSAIDAAVDGDEIVLSPATYTGPGNRDISYRGKAITVRSTDPLDPDVVAATIIDCDGTAADPHRAFRFDSGESSDAIIAGLTIINGHAPRDAVDTACEGGGGAILLFNADATIRSCVLRQNAAADGLNAEDDTQYGGAGGHGGHGGAICAFGADLHIEASVIEANRSGQGGDSFASWQTFGNGGRGGDGAGVYCEGVLTVSTSIIADNMAGAGGWGSIDTHGGPGGSGAGVFSIGTCQINGSTIRGNQAGAGGDGGAYAGAGGAGGGIYSTDSLAVEQTLILENAAGAGGYTYDYQTAGGSGGNGGGVFCRFSFSATRSVISDNTAGSGGDAWPGYGGAGGAGGGAYVEDTAEFFDSVITRNQAGSGSSGNIVGGAGGDAGGVLTFGYLLLQRCHLIGNSAGAGGANISGGRGGAGGGAYTFEELILQNSLLVGNRAGAGGYGEGTSGDGGSGGAICNTGGALISGCTLVENHAGSAGGFDPQYGTPGAPGTGGGVFALPTTTASSSILWGNSGTPEAQHSAGITVAYCDIEAYSGGGVGNLNADPHFKAAASGTWTASPAYDAESGQTTLIDTSANWSDGQLVAMVLRTSAPVPAHFLIAANSATSLSVWGDASSLATVGDSYTVLDHHLQPVSPCINAGDPAYIPQPGATDIDGDDRVLFGRVDMGADEATEWQYPCPSARLFVDDDAAPGGNGCSWATAYQELQEGLAAASETTGNLSEICVAEGIYTPDYDATTGTHNGDIHATFLLPSGVSIYGGFPSGGAGLDARDPYRHKTVLSGDLNGDDGANFTNYDDNSFSVLQYVAYTEDLPSLLDGLIIRSANGLAGIANYERGSFTIRSCVVERNLSPGILLWYSRAAIEDCQIRNNASSGIYLYEFCAATISSTAIIANLFHGVSVRSDYGTILRGCSVVDNGANGVFFVDHSAPAVVNSLIWGNMGRQVAITAFEPVYIGTPSISYTDLQGGSEFVYFGEDALIDWGAGNIDRAPSLTPEGHLRADSPCIGAGAVIGESVDIGADQFDDADEDRLPDWWEKRYFGTTLGVDQHGDADGDGISNLIEYEEFSSNPAAAPYYVNGAIGDDAYDGRTPDVRGSGLGPKRTIQAGISAANRGDTVLVSEGVYHGVGNYNLSFGEDYVVVRAWDGVDPLQIARATIDCAGNGRAIDMESARGRFGVLAGFIITGGSAANGAGVGVEGSRFMLKDCTLAGNHADDQGGGFYSYRSSPRIDDLVIETNTAPSGGYRFASDGGLIVGSNVTLRGTLAVRGESTIIAQSSWFHGPGSIELADGTRLYVSGIEPGELPTVLRSDLRGTGDVLIDIGQELRIEHGAIVDLSGEAGGGCADPGMSAEWGTIAVDGALVVRDATIQNTNVEVTLAEFDGAVGIINNDIRLLESSTGFGGQFFVQGHSPIRCNHTVSYGDRYLDLDPDPSIPLDERPIVEDNVIEVIITQGGASERGEVLELRTQDQDCDPETAPDGCPSGAHELAASPGYADTWALERLELEPDAKVSLTNRQGLVFQDPDIATPETVYVTELILGSGSVLNTGLQRLYYQSMSMGANSQIVDVPLLGFSLGIIAMEDDTEFDVRVRRRIADPRDVQPGNCVNEPATCLEGQIVRFDDSTHGGLMQVATRAPDRQQASSVAAKGAFARASEAYVVVAFEYLFTAGGPNTELIVYLSDKPDVSENLVELAHVRPPPAGRPGSIGSGSFALFYGIFPRGSLNFVCGTYVELELRGDDAGVLIDNWDPQIRCVAECGDYAPPDGADPADYLVLLAEAGRPLDMTSEVDFSKACLETPLSGDHYLDVTDVYLMDTFLGGEALNLCPDASRAVATAPASRGSAVPLPSTESMLLAGKSAGSSEQQDHLYVTRVGGSCMDDPLPPASVPHDIEGYRGNGRLVQDGGGIVYQIHGEQGLIRLDTASVVIPPTVVQRADDTVYVGTIPLLDVAFHPTDNSIAYVTPVLVAPNHDLNRAYRASAKVAIIEQPAGDYQIDVLQVYGMNPDEDPCVTVEEVGGGVLLLRDPDLQRVREIDVDASGNNVFVITAQALGQDNDWLLVFDEATGEGTRISRYGTYPDPTSTTCPAPTGPGLPLPVAPTALTLSQCGNQLFLTSSAHGQTCWPAQACTTQVEVFDLQYSGSRVTGLTHTRTIQIDNTPTLSGEDYGYGHLSVITDLIEHPDTCALYALGFTAARVDPELDTQTTLYKQRFGTDSPLFTTPTLAVLAAGSDSGVAAPLPDTTLALPISGVIQSPGVCPGGHDSDADCDVDLADVARLQRCAATVDEADPACLALFDCNQDGAINRADAASFTAAMTGALHP